MTEYALVLVGVVLLAAGAYRTLGGAVKRRTDDGTVQLGGGAAGGAVGAAGAGAAAPGAGPGMGAAGGNAGGGAGGAVGGGAGGAVGGGAGGAAGGSVPAGATPAVAAGGGGAATPSSPVGAATAEPQVGGRLTAAQKLNMGLGGGGSGPSRTSGAPLEQDLTLTRLLAIGFLAAGLLTIAISVLRAKKKSTPPDAP